MSKELKTRQDKTGGATAETKGKLKNGGVYSAWTVCMYSTWLARGSAMQTAERQLNQPSGSVMLRAGERGRGVYSTVLYICR